MSEKRRRKFPTPVELVIVGGTLWLIAEAIAYDPAGRVRQPPLDAVVYGVVRLSHGGAEVPAFDAQIYAYTRWDWERAGCGGCTSQAGASTLSNKAYGRPLIGATAADGSYELHVVANRDQPRALSLVAIRVSTDRPREFLVDVGRGATVRFDITIPMEE